MQSETPANPERDDGITLTALLDQLDQSNDRAELSVDDVIYAIGERGYAPLTLILALIAMLPTGAVPGVPTVCGVSIALVSLQLAFGKRYPWLPARLRRVSISHARYTKTAERIKPWTRRLDRLVRPRLDALVEGGAARAIGLLFVVLALCMPPLELLPFAAAAPASAIALISLGLAGRDGLWVLLGLMPAALGGWLIYGLLA